MKIARRKASRFESGEGHQINSRGNTRYYGANSYGFKSLANALLIAGDGHTSRAWAFCGIGRATA